MSSAQDPFDRSTSAPQMPALLTPEEQWTQRLIDAKREALVHAEMALAFLSMLKTQLTHEEALDLTGKIWRSWPAS